MKKSISAWLFAGLIILSNPSESVSINQFETISEDTNDKVSSLLTYKNNNDFSELIRSNLSKNLVDTNNHLLFPSSTISLWIDRVIGGVLWNVEKWWLDMIHPPFVDYWWFTQVYCAWTIKWFLASFKNPSNRTSLENSYINREGIDAWMLPDELRRTWLYFQLNDLMKFFDYSKVWQRDIVKDKNWYRQSLLETGEHLKNNWVPWSILFIYFNLSSYKDTVKRYNDQKLLRNPNANLSINTHQAIFLWNSFIEFNADEVKNFDRNRFVEMESEVDSINFIANFVQQRSWYKSWLNLNTRNTILENMKTFHSMIELEVNWIKVDLAEELNKLPIDRFKVSKNDKIRIYWPILMDWFHDANSENKYISENNHARTVFYFEFVTLWTYTPSELLVPNENLKNIHWDRWNYFDLTDQIEVSNLYYLKKHENIWLKLRESILRFEFWKISLLNYTQEEIDLLNSIQVLPRNSRERNNLKFRYVSLRESRINSIYETLTNQEKNHFNLVLQRQIQWLQLMWYIQNEWIVNPWTTNVNSPIPYFKIDNINSIFTQYVDIRKKEILWFSESDIDIENDDSISLYFFPGDNFATIFSQLQNKLNLYSNKYSNFSRLDSLDLFKKMKFIDIIVDRFSHDPSVDLTNWKIPSMRSLTIPFTLIDDTLEEILNESYIDTVELSDLDSLIINIISKSKQDYDMLAHILVHESYERWLPYRKFLKEIWRFLWKTSSYWDFQLKLANLKNRNNSLVMLPNVYQLQRAISYVNDPSLEQIIERRRMRFEDNIEQDLKILEQIQEKIKYVEFYTDEQRLQAWNQVYDSLRDLFRFNDSRHVNVIWKVVQTSLILDKMNDHHFNLIAWIRNSGVSIDEILYNDDLLKRYHKLLLVINNRSERIALIWTSESYLLRILETIWEDINAEDYPKLERDWKGHINYNNWVITERFEFYKNRILSLDIEEWFKEILISEIDNLISKNFSALEIYSFFRNKVINEFLENNWRDSIFLPTLEEYNNTAFRELFYDYAKKPIWMTPPKNYNITKVLWFWWAWWILWIAWIAAIIRRKINKNKTTK